MFCFVGTFTFTQHRNIVSLDMEKSLTQTASHTEVMSIEKMDEMLKNLDGATGISCWNWDYFIASTA